jgi:hypothetical protein
MDAASDPNVTLSSFIADPTPEQHIPKALALLRTLVALQTHRSKLSSRKCGRAPLAAPFLNVRLNLKGWFDNSLCSSEPGRACISKIGKLVHGNTLPCNDYNTHLDRLLGGTPFRPK